MALKKMVIFVILDIREDNIMNIKPGLFGIKYSNRDFEEKDNWGKNKFNSSFPIALCNYMDSKKLKLVYLKFDQDKEVEQGYLESSELYCLPENYKYDDVFFEFEGAYEPHNTLDENHLRSDVVVRSIDKKEYHHHLEVKLTALPDNATANKKASEYGSELVIRTVTIIHLAINVIEIYKDNTDELKQELTDVYEVKDFQDEKEVIKKMPKLYRTLEEILLKNIQNQKPLVLQPIWKTIGKQAILEEHSLDVFVWSDFALAKLFMDSTNLNGQKIDRYSRSIIWVLYLLKEYVEKGKIDSKDLYKKLTYGLQSDKAFAANGNKTNKYMFCEELLKPRIKTEEIKNIILGGGEKLLSPERRFDATIFYSVDKIFE